MRRAGLWPRPASSAHTGCREAEQRASQWERAHRPERPAAQRRSHPGAGASSWRARPIARAAPNHRRDRCRAPSTPASPADTSSKPHCRQSAAPRSRAIATTRPCRCRGPAPRQPTAAGRARRPASPEIWPTPRAAAHRRPSADQTRRHRAPRRTTWPGAAPTAPRSAASRLRGRETAARPAPGSPWCR